MNAMQRQFEDILSFTVLRIFAKKKKHMISDGDFQLLATFGAAAALDVITNKHRRQQLHAVIDGELRTTLELMSNQSCGRCHGRGITGHRGGGTNYAVCQCVNPVFYRGDSVLELGEQYSQVYLQGEFSTNALGQTDVVQNVCAAVMLFIMPNRR